MRERVSAACIKSLYKSLYKLRRALSLTYNAPLFVYYKNADLPTPGLNYTFKSQCIMKN